MLDELVEWTIFIATGKKGIMSKLNQFEMLKQKNQRKYKIYQISDKKSAKIDKNFYQLTLFDLI